ncbi:MAG: hypothetical protein Kow0098_15960 [Ignavibacteriaceae bacterium]
MYKHFHRRNLPHLYFSDGIYFITSRLINSIPVDKLEQLQSETKNTNDEKLKRLFQKYDALMDSGEYGEKYLKIPECADVVKTTLHYPDRKDYNLISYCIMPNHFHLVFKLLPLNKGISKIMQSIKRISARDCNKILKRTGAFWQDESFDRWVRDEKELYYVIRYVLLNPVNAGLVDDWRDWQFTYCHPDYLIL